MTRFAANLTMMFAERAFLDRFEAAAAAGFDAVEYLFPYAHPAETLAERLRANRLDQVLFNLPPGNWDAGERGMACLAGREAEFRESVATGLHYAAVLGCPRLHAMSGLLPDGADVRAVRETWLSNIAHAAAEADDAGLTLLIEPINPHDMPGYFLNDFGLALELIAELEGRGGPAPRLQFDIYHCAQIHGDVEAWIRRAADRIGHYQIAGVPDRLEPDRSEVDLAAILRVIEEETPGLAIGCEYHPAGLTEDGLGWFAPYRPR